MIPEQYRRKISKDEINAMPIRRYEGEVRLVRTPEELEAAVNVLCRESVLGFDTETKPTFRKGKVNAPSLVQFAATDVVFLIQLGRVPMGAEIAAVLRDAAIIKAGVSIIDDVRELCARYPFRPAGLVDLGDVARSLKMETQGLRNMAANFFGWRISKGPQCSNWGLPELTPRQIAYAATDAWVGRELYLKMCSLGLLARPFLPTDREKGRA